MKTSSTGLFLAAVLLACSGGNDPRFDESPSTALTSASHPHRITIIHVNDTHGTLDSVGPKDDDSVEGTLGGMTRAATVIQQIRDGTPNTLLVHAGDVFEGDLFFNVGLGTAGIPELALMKQLGFDVWTLGNHEFNYGPDLLATAIDQAQLGNVDVLSANLLLPEGSPHPLAAIVKKHAIRTVDGVRVGFFGLTTIDRLERPAPFVLSDDLEKIVDAEVQALRDPHQPGGPADIVVLLSHLGSQVDKQLAARPSGVGRIDVIVGGHDEVELSFDTFRPGKTIVVQAGHFYRKVGKLDLVLLNRRILQASHTLIPVDTTVKRHPVVNAAVQQLKGAIVDQFGADVFTIPIASAPATIRSKFDPTSARRDTETGDLVADSLHDRLPKNDFGLTTLGFVDNDDIFAGPVVAQDLFRAAPYGINPKLFLPGFPDLILVDPVGVYRFTGPQLCTAIEFALEIGEYPQVSGNVMVSFDSSKIPMLQEIVLDGESIRPDSGCVGGPYDVASNIVLAGLANQIFEGAGMDLIDIPQPDAEVNQFSVLVQYAAGKTLTTSADPRVVDRAVAP